MWTEYIQHVTEPEADLEGDAGGGRVPLFCNHLIFGNQFEELQTMLIEIKLIINNATLTYVYPNTQKHI